MLYFANNAFDLNTNQYVTGGGGPQGVPGVKPAEDRIHAHDVWVDLQIASGSSNPQQVCLYWFLAKTGSSSYPDSFWNNCQIDYSLNQSPATSAGFNATAGTRVAGTLGYIPFSAYGATPMYNSSFRKIYKCIKKKTIDLASGAVEKVKYKLKVNKTFDKAYLHNLYNTGSITIPGATVFVMAIVRGSPQSILQDSGSGSVVTTSKAEVLMTMSANYTFSALGQNRVPYNTADLGFVSSVTAGTGITKLMGELNAALVEAQVL
jgi:hypothetical protein